MSDNFCEEARKLLSSMTVALADDASSIKIEVVSGDHTTVFSVSADRNELGKLIGRGGKHAQSLRTILSAFAAKHNRRAVLEIADERNGDEDPGMRRNRRPRDDYDGYHR